jgi:hypothetical protein
MLEKHIAVMAMLTFSELPMPWQILPPPGEKCGLARNAAVFLLVRET